jgi:rubrerythrin
LGSRSECEIHPVEVKSTLENLKAALNGEQYEIDTMYPGFLEEATAHKTTSAMRTFTYALEAEKTHARLYGEAITLLAAGKKDSWIAEARDFYICPAIPRRRKKSTSAARSAIACGKSSKSSAKYCFIEDLSAGVCGLPGPEIRTRETCVLRRLYPNSCPVQHPAKRVRREFKIFCLTYCTSPIVH